tara:strand:+ start:5549 stop:6127 length:579 start_codon:yes stop_codon:yes gene_type:complete
MDEKYLFRRKLRKFQLSFATFIFLFILVYCWTITDYQITEIQLSKFGVHNDVKHWWNISMVLIAHFILRNVSTFLDENQRIKHGRIWKQFFGLGCLGLAIVGIVPMDPVGFDLHDLAAWGYFFLFPLTILSMAFFERKNIQHSEFLNHVILAALMAVLPSILFDIFHGLAIPELLHSSIVLYWNLYIFLKYK